MKRVPIFPPNYETNNWGDIISPVIVKALSGIEPYTGHKIPGSRNLRYLVCGSILNLAAPGDVLWGTGSIPPIKKLPGDLKVCAVRGPKTANFLTSHGVECPVIYGDPAMFMPYIHPVKPTHEYDLGIVPHFIDYGLVRPLLNKTQSNLTINLIDITAGVVEVMEEVAKCDAIASSGLHGIILSEALGIPAVFCQFSDNVWGGTFKFLDYYLGTGRETCPVVGCRRHIIPETIKEAAVSSAPPKADLSALLSSCPFNFCQIKKLEDLKRVRK